MRGLLDSFPDHPDLLAQLGTVRLQQGQTAEGISLLEKALRVSPDHPMALANLAAGLAASGKFEEALAASSRLLALQPSFADAFRLQGDALRGLNRREEALAAYGRAIALQPGNAPAHNNRGNALLELGRASESLAAYDAALSADPSYADAHFNRANALKDLGQTAEALEGYDRAIALKPASAWAHNNRGFLLERLKRPREALAAYDAATALDPRFAGPYNNRGNVLKGLHRFREALANYDRAIALEPGFAQAHNNRGALLKEMDRPLEALASLDRALSLQPSYAEAHNNRGNALLRLNRTQEALAAYDAAIALRPGYAEAHGNRGNALKDLGRLEEALESYDRAIALDPAFARAYCNKALLLLLKGDFTGGWPLFEWRWKDTLRPEASRFAQPAWAGGPLAGQTLLIHPEQGYGDILQFCRYALLAERAGAQVVLESPRSLVPVLSTLRGDFTVVERGGPLPPFTLRCPVMSLPLAFGTRVETIPAEVPYLFADEAKRAAWREKLGPRSKPRVGLVFSGKKENSNDHNRSLPLEALAPLFGLPLEFHSLQKEVREADQEALLRLPQLRDHQKELADFSDTAALIAEMDLTLSVDTAAAHLAGALGKPVWVLLPRWPDPRWLLGRADSPWYPTAVLFRQGAIGDWDSVMAEVISRLREKFG